MCCPSVASFNINTVFPVLRYGYQLHCTRGLKIPLVRLEYLLKGNTGLT
jgi:hypothetical protein